MSSRARTFLQQLAASPEAERAAVSDNCRFDERTDARRWEDFEARLPGGADALSWADWGEAGKLHYDQRVTVPSLSVPDAFLDINRRAWKSGLEGNQTVVRIELLIRPLAGADLSFDELQELWKKRDQPDPAHTLADFFETWNRRRDGRPSFVAFYDEVRDEVEDDDWPHALRDRLGLGHYKGSPATPLPIALMRYSLQEALEAQARHHLATACALPTVLDGGMHEFFFPTPAEHPYGATLHLDPGQADLLTAELLHCPIHYRPEHLHRLGTISRPHGVRGDTLREARDLHLTSLRIESGRDTFGEEMRDRHA